MSPLAVRLRRAWQVVYRRYAIRANVTIGARVHIGLGTILWAPQQLTVGDDVYIGKGCTVECDGSIASSVLIGNRVGIVGRRDHDIHAIGESIRHSSWVGDADGPESSPVRIETDVWVGYGAIVLSGVTVGRGAVVAAGAVVTHDVKPYTIVGGNPAREIGVRFEGEQRREHEILLDRTRPPDVPRS